MVYFDEKMDCRVPGDVDITSEVLAQCISEMRAIATTRYKKLYDAYLTDYPIFHAEKKPRWKPDNRIAVNFAKYLVDMMGGFFMGIPVKVTSDDEKVSDYINLFDAYNDQDDANFELAKNCDIFGRGYEMYYVDENGQICTAVLSPLESFMIYDDSILKRRRAFVRIYKDTKGVYHGSISDAQTVRYFRTLSAKWEGEERYHGFKFVPAVEYVENEEKQGLFEPVLSMIHAYNKAISEKANDVDAFADAYMKILGPKVENEDVEHIRDDRLINFEGTGASDIVVDFMAKPTGDTTQENLIDRLERLIFSISMVANLSDENFGTTSGIALRYKLLAMSNLAQTKERKFTSSMNLRYKTVFSNPISKMGADDFAKVRCKFTLNYPANITDEIEQARNLDGIVSTETQLSVLSIVDDVKAEVDRMNEETRNTLGDSTALRNLFEEMTNEQP